VVIPRIQFVIASVHEHTARSIIHIRRKVLHHTQHLSTIALLPSLIMLLSTSFLHVGRVVFLLGPRQLDPPGIALRIRDIPPDSTPYNLSTRLHSRNFSTSRRHRRLPVGGRRLVLRVLKLHITWSPPTLRHLRLCHQRPHTAKQASGTLDIYTARRKLLLFFSLQQLKLVTGRCRSLT